MTTNIEQKFFETFGIEPEYKTCIFKYCKNKKEYDCENCDDREWHYPQITAERLLKLLCVVSHYEPLSNYQVTLEELKNTCLERLIELSDISWIKTEVQSLFTEVGE